ncbi:MAG: hypothetical protein OXU45_00930 [Candidatus Melainabacteria bacterium]|nr:hypothetical protein [Candidatus Melainabacteria bacterium]
MNINPRSSLIGAGAGNLTARDGQSFHSESDGLSSAMEPREKARSLTQVGVKHAGNIGAAATVEISSLDLVMDSIIGNFENIPADLELRPDSDLRDELRADDEEILAVVTDLEDQLDISLPDAGDLQCDTIAELVEIVDQAIEQEQTD